MTQKHLTMQNWIQNHILLELTRHKARRFTQLRPRDVESNLFMYHLKSLLKEGLVHKVDEGYELTAAGMQLVATVSLQTGKPRRQPQILTAVACKNESGQQLLARWHRQPNVGRVSVVHGMLHYGKRPIEMAVLELAEKAGLTANLTHLADVYIREWQNDDVAMHRLVHMFEAQAPRPLSEAPLRPEVAEGFWAHLDELAPADFVPGFYELACQYQQGHLGAKLVEIDVHV